MNLLFDLDGTLTDAFPGITNCICHALVKMGRPSPPPDSLRWCIGPPLKDSLAKLLGSNDNGLVQKALSLYRERYSTVGLFENEVYDGIPECLKALNDSGHTLYVATSKPKGYAKRIVDHFGLCRNFKEVYGSELDGTRNDKRHLIAYILQKEVVDRAEAVMIGDREQDILGAVENGIGSIGVLWGYGTQKELDASGARDFVATPRELIHAVMARSGRDVS